MKPLPKPLQKEFTHFLSRHPPRRLNQNLRTMLLEFMQRDEAMECPYMKDLLFDLQGLFVLLDAAEGCELSDPEGRS